MKRNSIIASLHAAARTAAWKACVDWTKCEKSQESLSSLIQPIVRDLTNYPKVVVETRLIRLAVLLTYVFTIIMSVSSLCVLRLKLGLLVSALVIALFMLMMLFLCRLIVSGYIEYKIKFPKYYASHDL